MASDVYETKQYFYYHIAQLIQLGRLCATRVKKMYPDSQYDDLFIEALTALYMATKNVDPAKTPTLPVKYLYTYAFGSCLREAKRQLGISRNRSKENTEPRSCWERTSLSDPETIIELLDCHHSANHHWEDNENWIINKMDTEIILSKLTHSSLRTMLELILQGKDYVDICEELDISTSTYYYRLNKLTILVEKIIVSLQAPFEREHGKSKYMVKSKRTCPGCEVSSNAKTATKHTDEHCIHTKANRAVPGDHEECAKNKKRSKATRILQYVKLASELRHQDHHRHKFRVIRPISKVEAPQAWQAQNDNCETEP